MSHRRKDKYNHQDIYGTKSKQVDDTEGNPLYDARIIQYKREIKQLKEKIELQTELNRQLERDKNELSSKLESYKKKCSDLQKNLDDKDQHLNEVLMGIAAQHSVNHHLQYVHIFCARMIQSNSRQNVQG